MFEPKMLRCEDGSDDRGDVVGGARSVVGWAKPSLSGVMEQLLGLAVDASRPRNSNSFAQLKYVW